MYTHPPPHARTIMYNVCALSTVFHRRGCIQCATTRTMEIQHVPRLFVTTAGTYISTKNAFINGSVHVEFDHNETVNEQERRLNQISSQ